MANEGRVELEAVARVEDAIRDFERLEGQIRDLLTLADKGPGAIQIGVDADAVRARLREIKDAIESVRDSGVEISTERAERQIERLGDKIDRLDRDEGVVRIDADSEPAIEELAKLRRRFRKELDRLEDETRRADPLEGLSEEVAREALEMIRELQKLERRFESAVDRLNRAGKRTDFDPLSKSAQSLREGVRVAALEIVEFGDRSGPALQRAGQGFSFVEDQAAKARQAVTKYTGEIRAALDQIEAERAVIEIEANAEPAIDELAELRRRYRQEIDRLKDETRRADPLAGLSEEVARESLEMVRELRELERRFDHAVTRLNRAAKRTDFDPMSRSAQSLRENVRVAAIEIVEFSGRARPALRSTGQDFDFVEKQAEQARRAVNQYTREIQEASNVSRGGLTKSIDSLATGVKGLVGAVASLIALDVLQWLGDMSRSLIEAARASDRVSIKFGAVFDTAEQGSQEMERAAKLADEWGISIEGVEGKLPDLLIALEALGFTLEQQHAITDAVQIGLRGLGADSEQVGGVLKALTDIASKGVLQMEELRQQLGDRFAGAVQRLADELGVSTDRLEEMSRNGELLAKDTIPLLAKILLEFEDNAKRAADGVDASFNRLDNSMLLFGRRLGEEIAPALTELLTLITGTDAEITDASQSVGLMLNALLEVASSGVAGVRQVIAVVQNFRATVLEAFAEFQRLIGNDQAAKVLDEYAKGYRKIADAQLEVVRTALKAEKAVREGADSGRASADEQRKVIEQLVASHGDNADAAEQASERITADQERLSERIASLTEKSTGEQIQSLEQLRAEHDRISSEIEARTSQRTEEEEARAEELFRALEQVNLRLRDLAEETTDEQVDEYERLKEEFERITEEITALSEERADAEKQLTDEQVESLKKVQAELEKQIAAAEKAAERDLAAIQKRTQGWLKFAQDLRRVFDQIEHDEAQATQRRERASTPISGPSFESSGSSDPGLDAAIQQVAALRAELVELEAERDKLEDAPIVTAESIGRVDELHDRIQQLRATLGEMESGVSTSVGLDLELSDPSPAEQVEAEIDRATEAARQRGEALRGVLRDMVSSEDFAASFRELPTAAQDGVREILESLDQIAPYLGDQRDRIARDMADVARIFEESGQAPAGFAEQLRGAFGSAGGEAESLMDVFDRLQGSVSSSAEGVEGASERITTAGEKAGDTAVQTEKGAEGWKVWNEAAKGAAEGAEEASSAADSAAESGQAVADSMHAGADASRALADSLGPTLELLRELVAVSGEGAGITPLVEGITALGGQAETLPQVAEGLRLVSESVLGMAEHAEPIRELLTAISEHLADEDQAQRLRDRAEAWGLWREQLTGAATDLETIASGLERYAAVGDPVDEASTKIQEALARVSDPSLVEALREEAEILDQIAEGIDTAATNAQVLNPEVETLVRLSGDWLRASRFVADIIDRRLLPSMEQLEKRAPTTGRAIEDLSEIEAHSVRATNALAEAKGKLADEIARVKREAQAAKQALAELREEAAQAVG